MQQPQSDSSPKIKVVEISPSKRMIFQLIDTLQKQHKQIPQILDFIRTFDAFWDNGPEIEALQPIAAQGLVHMAADPQAHLFEVLAFLDAVWRTKRECIRRYRRGSMQNATRERRREIFKALKYYLNSIDGNWQQDRTNPDKRLTKKEAVSKVWEEHQEKIRKLGKLPCGFDMRIVSENFLRKRFEEYIQAYSFRNTPMPSGRKPKKYNINFLKKTSLTKVWTLKRLCEDIFDVDENDPLFWDGFDFPPDPSNISCLYLAESSGSQALDTVSNEFYRWRKE